MSVNTVNARFCRKPPVESKTTQKKEIWQNRFVQISLKMSDFKVAVTSDQKLKSSTCIALTINVLILMRTNQGQDNKSDTPM